MKKLIYKIVILAVAVFIIYNIINLFTSESGSVIAELETMEISYRLNGVVIRDENLVNVKTKTGGVLDVTVSESEMVPKGKHVATYYDSQIDDKAKEELSKINQQISELNRATDDTIAEEMSVKEIDEEIGRKMDSISYASPERNMSIIKSLKNDVNDLLSKKEGEVEEEVSVSERLEELKKQKADIERKYPGKKTEITAPQHGVFSTGIDGYEDVMTPELALEITVTDFENAQKQNFTADDIRQMGALCKIVDNSMWYVSLVADETVAKSFAVGDSVVMRFDGDNTEAKGTVEYISPGQSEKYMITISSSSYCVTAMEARFATLTVVKESNTGLKIPLSAIRVKDGKSGVYVKTENTLKYKEIDVLTKDDKYAIVRFDNTRSGSLLLYDEVVID